MGQSGTKHLPLEPSSKWTHTVQLIEVQHWVPVTRASLGCHQRRLAWVNVGLFAFTLAGIQAATSQSTLECFQLKGKNFLSFKSFDSLGYSQMCLPGSSGNKRDPLSKCCFNCPSKTYLWRSRFSKYWLWVLVLSRTLRCRVSTGRIPLCLCRSIFLQRTVTSSINPML